jgi:hypothetical protein
VLARSWRVVPGILLLAATSTLAAASLDADPHDLYEAAHRQLRKGDLQAAEASIARLRDLVARGSRWDPDGIFANELLPPLAAKWKRMDSAARELDDFCAHPPGEPKLPDHDNHASSGEEAGRVASRIQDLRKRRDGILEKLRDPEERDALTRTASYACTEGLLEEDVLRSLAASSRPEPHAETPAAGSGDPRVDPILVRLKQLKQDLMQSVAERDQLRQKVKSSGDREAALLTALADILSNGALPAPSGGSGTQSVSGLFSSFLDREMEAARPRQSQTSAELAVRRADLNRYRRYNALLLQIGLGEDQSDRIQALSQAVEGIQVSDQRSSKSFRAGRGNWLLLATLSLIASVSTWLAIACRLRHSSPDRTMGSPIPIRRARTHDRNEGGHAA